VAGEYCQTKRETPLISEISCCGRTAYSLPAPLGTKVTLPSHLARNDLDLPELSEPEVVAHFLALSQKNYGVDSGFYPLGSCTMKYNPKIADRIASLPGFAETHPLQDESSVQGTMELMHELECMLCEVCGMDAFTLQPPAGASGEFTGALIIKRCLPHRNEIIIPDSAHGTNPASAAMAGFTVTEIPSNEEGMVDIDALRSAVSERTAGMMLTNPNTLGIFEEDILEIAQIVHNAGGLLYYDGANLNAIAGIARPGDMGFDIVHVNLHKTFGTPHGGGGPGSGPVGVKQTLEKYLPVPRIKKEEGRYFWDYKKPETIGKVHTFYGNFGIMVRAYVYLLSMGNALQEMSEIAVLNANYIAQKLKTHYELPYKELRKHEVVISCEKIKRETGVSAADIAKRLLDFGLHAPTTYFPLIVHEALMIEPTESVSRAELDRFCDAMIRIHGECYSTPDIVKSAPHNTSVRRLDDVRATKEPVLSWKMMHP